MHTHILHASQKSLSLNLFKSNPSPTSDTKLGVYHQNILQPNRYTTPGSKEYKTFCMWVTYRWPTISECIMKHQITDFVKYCLCGYLEHFHGVCLHACQKAFRLQADIWNSVSCNCMLYYADTLPSGGIDLVTIKLICVTHMQY